jgi:hypothetical protein
VNDKTPAFSGENTSAELDAEFQELFQAEPLFYVMVDIYGRAWGRPSFGATVEDITVEPDIEVPGSPIIEVDSVAWTVWNGSTRSQTRIRGGKYKVKKG